MPQSSKLCQRSSEYGSQIITVHGKLKVLDMTLYLVIYCTAIFHGDRFKSFLLDNNLGFSENNFVFISYPN